MLAPLHVCLTIIVEGGLPNFLAQSRSKPPRGNHPVPELTTRQQSSAPSSIPELLNRTEQRCSNNNDKSQVFPQCEQNECIQ